MANELKVEVAGSTKVTAVTPKGESQIVFEITNQGGEALDLTAELTIPWGTKKDDQGRVPLLGTNNESVVVIDTVPKVNGRRRPQEPPDKILWYTPGKKGFPLAKGGKLTITITQFVAPLEGRAAIELKVTKVSTGELLNKECSFVISVLPLPPEADVAIIEFAADPAYVRAGDLFVFSGYTANAKHRALFHRDQERAVWSEKEGTTKLPSRFEATITAPSETARYTLKAWRTLQTETDEGDFVGAKPPVPPDGRRVSLDVHVQEQGKWSSRPLVPGHYPALLLKTSPNWDGSKKEKLYGVFINEKTKAASLWSSVLGFDDWIKVDDVPSGMGESPGVIYEEWLWLIGGSSADPRGLRSNRVCRWNPLEKIWIDDKEEKDGTLRFSPRMGHACEVFDKKIWVLGGFSKDSKPLGDVWTCQMSQKGSEKVPQWEIPKKVDAKEVSLDAAKCMLNVVATPKEDIRFKKPRLWVYGGTDNPGNLEAADKLGYIDSGYAWNDSPLPSFPKNPVGATLLYAEGSLHIAGYFLTRKEYLASERMHHLTSVTPPIWISTSGDVSWKWTFVRTEMFLIRSVSFKRHWIFYPVYRYMDELTTRLPRVYVESD